MKSLELRNRFVNDYKLPISVTDNSTIFNHWVYSLEDTHKALTKSRQTMQLINERFGGDERLFLDEYYRIREEVIQYILNHPDFIEFNEKRDMNQYKVDDLPKLNGNAYNCDHDGGVFLSIDLKSANFQTLRYVSPELMRNTNRYSEFIATFTDIDYIKESKYFRSVVFGKCNPKRHITVEKYLINKVRHLFEEKFNTNDHFTLIVVNTDELIYKTDLKLEDISQSWLDSITVAIQQEFDLTIKCEKYQLESWELKKVGKDSVTRFFIKRFSETEIKYLGLPQQYYLIVKRLMGNNPILDMDMIFMYDGCQAKFNENFYIQRFTQNNKV